MSTAITVRGVSKRYRIGLAEERSETFAGQIMDMVKAPLRNLRQLRSLSRFKEEDESVFWALRDIEFDVQEGEVLGIIGHNGAGKSTLLKILSRITEPTTGEIKINGKVSSLLEVGTGFHPDLTGRENIYMNGTILGMRKKEIDRKLDEIVAFSGVSKYIDTPVKRYSSGMKVRLAFSVAAHLEPEVLIIDEVLAVGDAEFQAKCIGKMEDVAQEGRTVIFVSHQMGAVTKLTTKCILLSKGIIKGIGDTPQIVQQYLDFNRINNDLINTSEYFSMFSLTICNGQNIEVSSVNFSEYFSFEFNMIPSRKVEKVSFFYRLENSQGEIITTGNSIDNNVLVNMEVGIKIKLSHKLRCENILLPGRYYLTFALHDHYGNVLEAMHQVYCFDVTTVKAPKRLFKQKASQGNFYLRGEWECNCNLENNE